MGSSLGVGAGRMSLSGSDQSKWKRPGKKHRSTITKRRVVVVDDTWGAVRGGMMLKRGLVYIPHVIPVPSLIGGAALGVRMRLIYPSLALGNIYSIWITSTC